MSNAIDVVLCFLFSFTPLPYLFISSFTNDHMEELFAEVEHFLGRPLMRRERVEIMKHYVVLQYLQTKEIVENNIAEMLA